MWNQKSEEESNVLEFEVSDLITGRVSTSKNGMTSSLNLGDNRHEARPDGYRPTPPSLLAQLAAHRSQSLEAEDHLPSPWHLCSLGVEELIMIDYLSTQSSSLSLPSPSIHFSVCGLLFLFFFLFFFFDPFPATATAAIASSLASTTSWNRTFGSLTAISSGSPCATPPVTLFLFFLSLFDEDPS
jgi:hypothetical protein